MRGAESRAAAGFPGCLPGDRPLRPGGDRQAVAIAADRSHLLGRCRGQRFSAMARSDPKLLQTALLGLYQQAIADHRLLAESQRARREFFGSDDARPTVTQHLRFVEWFLLEHESLALATVPIEVLAVEGSDEAVLDSAAGVYRVETVDGESATLQDLQEDETVDVEVPAGALQAGDLVVGRLYPIERGTWQPSPAIAVYRPGAGIAAA